MGRHRQGARVLGPYRFKARGLWRVILVGNDGTQTVAYFETEAEAIKVAEAARQQCPSGDQRTVAEALDAYEDYLRRKGNKFRSVSVGISAVRHFLGDDHRQVRGLTAATLKHCIEARTAEGKRVDTVASGLRNTKTFLTWCVKQGWTPETLARHLSDVKVVGRRSTGKAQLTRDESVRLVQTALEIGGEGPAVALCLLLLGLRLREILDRRVRDLDSDCTVLWVRDAKTPTGNRRVELPDVLQGLLHKLAEGKGQDEFLFSQKEGGKARSSTFGYKWVKRLCARAGVPVICPHGLRGTHSTLADAAGVTSHVVAASLGHADDHVTGRHYTRPDAREGARRARFLKVLEGGGEPAGTAEKGG